MYSAARENESRTGRAGRGADPTSRSASRSLGSRSRNRWSDHWAHDGQTSFSPARNDTGDSVHPPTSSMFSNWSLSRSGILGLNLSVPEPGQRPVSVGAAVGVGASSPYRPSSESRTALRSDFTDFFVGNPTPSLSELNFRGANSVEGRRSSSPFPPALGPRFRREPHQSSSSSAPMFPPSSGSASGSGRPASTSTNPPIRLPVPTASHGLI